VVENAEHDSLHSPTALLSMISCALVLAAMIVFGLAERAPLKKLRMKLMVGECGDCSGRSRGVCC